jgi:hypothetical protein
VATESEVETRLQELKLEVLQTWFTDEVLRADEETGFSAILIFWLAPDSPYTGISTSRQSRESVLVR